MLFDIDDMHMMDWWFGIFGSYWWIFMALGWLLVFVTGLAIAYYIHKDAIKIGVQNSEVWLIIGLIFNVFGLLLYFLVRGNYKIGGDLNRLSDRKG